MDEILGKGITTGDTEFDEIFRVFSSDMNATSFLSSAENRKLIRDIFEAGFKTFTIKSGHIEIIKPYHNLEDELRQDKIMYALETLYKLGLA
ncbi:MAG: hypothetical protein L6420_00720 [Elusimicrobia bacterium]|nr:hypothetical protein [Elusimicrobiota bacterium]